MPLASSLPVWARQWHKFFVERVGIDALQLGLLLLMLLSLLTLFLSIMSVSLRFCCCAHRTRRHRKFSPTTMPNRVPSHGFFTGSNEERRCLLQPNGVCNADAKQITVQNIDNANGEQQQERAGRVVAGTSAAQPQQQAENVVIVVEPVKPQLCQISSTPLMAHRGHLMPHRPTNFPAESPPPPRRFASGGRTQVLPLTSQNCRRVPPLVMLMADQQQQQRHQVARGRMPTTPDSRAITTTTNGGAIKSCATIPEDPEEASRPLPDELISIDRTFVSVGDEPQEMIRVVQRLPIHQPAPIFEVQPPSYSPPEPPNKMMGINICRESNNLSRCSYGGTQTPLNTTTGSSADPSVDGSMLINRNVEVRISELESETDLDRNGFGNAELALPGRRVPRSISQQLELMNMTTTKQS